MSRKGTPGQGKKEEKTNENQPEMSAADFLASHWQDTGKYEILYRGKSLVVEYEIRPTEAVVATRTSPADNSLLMEKVMSKIRDDDQLRSKLNPKNLDKLKDNPSEFIDLMMEDESILDEAMKLGAEEARSSREVNKQIVIACALNPRFTTEEDFRAKKQEYLTATVKTFPVEFISDRDLQDLANKMTGKHMIWEENTAEEVSSFPDA